MANPVHKITDEISAIRQTKPGFGIVDGRDAAAHGYLPFSNELGAADVNVVTAAAFC